VWLGCPWPTAVQDPDGPVRMLTPVPAKLLVTETLVWFDQGWLVQLTASADDMPLSVPMLASVIEAKAVDATLDALMGILPSLPLCSGFARRIARDSAAPPPQEEYWHNVRNMPIVGYVILMDECRVGVFCRLGGI
jgi:hypothetical protein